MSRIVIRLKENSISAARLMELRRVVGGSLHDLKRRILHHQPIFDHESFNNRFDEFRNRLIQLVTLFRDQSMAHDIFELPEDVPFESPTLSEGFRIDDEILVNLLQHDVEGSGSFTGLE